LTQVRSAVTLLTLCDGIIADRTLYEDVIVPAGSRCVLHNVVVRANVRCKGSLLLDGGSDVSGNIQVVAGPGELVEFGRAFVKGVLSVSGIDGGGGTLVVKAGALLGPVQAERWGPIQLRDCEVLSLQIASCNGGLALSNAIVGDVVSMDGGSGSIELEGSTVGSIMTVAGCAPCRISTDAATKVNKGLGVESSNGFLKMAGSVFEHGDLIVSNFKGDIELEGVTIGDLSVNEVTGSLRLTNITADSDSTFDMNTGSLYVEGSRFSGDFRSTSAWQRAVVRSTTFDGEAVLISGCSGPILLEGNRDLSLTLTSNHDSVTLQGNDIIEATVTGTQGSAVLTANTFDVLRCLGNAEVRLSDNDVRLLRAGQCELDA